MYNSFSIVFIYIDWFFFSAFFLKKKNKILSNSNQILSILNTKIKSNNSGFVRVFVFS